MKKKFRFYDSEEQKMFDVTRIEFEEDDNVIIFLNSLPVLKRNVNSNLLLASTGKKDITEKEIYQGDIVTGIYSCSALEKKFFFDGVVKWDDEDLCFFFETDNEYCPYIKIPFTHKLKIIGNIYQNKK